MSDTVDSFTELVLYDQAMPLVTLLEGVYFLTRA